MSKNYKHLLICFLTLFISNIYQPVFSQNLLINGDFENGNISGFDVNGQGYSQVFPPAEGFETSSPGDFAILDDPILLNTSFFISGGDHTTGDGLMLAFDGNDVGGQQRFWRAGTNGNGVCGLQIGESYHLPTLLNL